MLVYTVKVNTVPTRDKRPSTHVCLYTPYLLIPERQSCDEGKKKSPLVKNIYTCISYLHTLFKYMNMYYVKCCMSHQDPDFKKKVTELHIKHR